MQANPHTRIFDRADWAAGAVVFLIALAVYVHSLPPTVTLEDAGELIVAADRLGVPHPPGYPVWTLLNHGFCSLFRWVRYYGRPDPASALLARSFREWAGGAEPGGYPNPAWAVAFGSAVAGALACGFLALLVRRAGLDALRGAWRRGTEEPGPWVAHFSGVSAVSAGLTLAFTPVFWSQSLIAEVYSLNALFLSLVLVQLYRWMRRPSHPGPLLAMCFLFGLGLTNHQTLLFLGPALAVAILARAPRIFLHFLRVGIPWAALVGFSAWAAMTGRPLWGWTSGPAFPAFWVHTALSVLVPLAVRFGGREGRIASNACLLVLLGLAFYLYLPIASSRNPPMNWGYAQSWEGFLHMVSRGQYEQIRTARLFSRAFVAQVGVFLRDLRLHFTFPLLLLGFLPFCGWSFRAGGRRLRAFPVAMALFALSLGLTAPEMLLRAAGAPDAAVHVLALVVRLCLVLFGLTALFGSSLLLTAFLYRLQRLGRRRTGPRALLTTLPAAGLVLALAYAEVQWTRILLRGGLSPGEAMGLLFLMLAPPSFLLLSLRGLRGPARLRFDAGIPAQGWLLVTAVGFLFLGIVFLIFQNLPLDLHTQFVGRVQFIPAHALVALWIGFGLLGALALVARLAPGRPKLQGAAALLALALPLGPVWDNAFNPEQLRLLGGAEQRGHDFGWLYGDGMLRGADAIRASLSTPGGDAYPTPGYPPPLENNAILFGGSDAGRFVPTYLIFSAGVRPDVFLLTQNALADPTYMAATRDFYGDRIRLPARKDGARALHQFLESMDPELRDSDPTIRQRGEQVTVQGLDHVMGINAILSREIFEANRDRHPFYIEESFPLPWMAEHQEPHGFVLRIHAEPFPLCPDRVAEDRLFWDWTVRQLLANPRFLRDAAARRAFAGLRATLAGFYQARDREDEAEIAYLQALMLQPSHTTAAYRLADIYLRQGRFDAAILLLQILSVQDPLNRATWEYLDFARDLAHEAGVTPP